MELPVRILRDELPAEPGIAIDGAMGARGLELSHWPGQRTPAELRHDLSTGSALRFAALPRARREELARGCRWIANNHFDTDGVCALFAVRHPEAALARAQALLAAARAGDFFAVPDERAFALDALISGLVDPGRSPLPLEGLEPLQRHQAALEHLLERLPAILDGDLEPYRALWAQPLEDLRADRADLAACTRDGVAHLEWSVWTARAGARSSRAGAPERFDPGRHALFADGDIDRALVIGPGPRGTSYRLLVSTLSWFELVSRQALPRPDLERLAAHLNALEGSAPGDAHAWRAQASDSPSPELWFGGAELEPFAEHAGEALKPSNLAPAVVRRAIAEALRAALRLPV